MQFNSYSDQIPALSGAARCGALLCLLVAGPAAAQNPAPAAPGSVAAVAVVTSSPSSNSPEHSSLAPRAAAGRLSGAIELDGRINEPAWAGATVIENLRQRVPNEGADATFRTEVRVLYDNEAIYVAARMFDNEPDKIVGYLARRDSETGADYILIQFDPYHNHNGDASFMLNPSGTRWDGGNGDVSWDPIWQGKAHIDSLGWTAEMRIPFSQLRFRPGSSEPWGFQVERFISRLNEQDVFSFWRRNEDGGPARWGHIDGIVSPSKVPGRLELLPYVVSQAQLHDEIDNSDPFAARREGLVRAGTDLKYQISSSLTLSATINPDFGQAEVDPAVVNLSAFETFFDEKREFFIEGRDKFRFGSLWCFTCSNASSLSMLFTRRIGRPPQAAGLAFSGGDYADVPEATTILGAAKLTGRTSGGWNIGVMNAVTAREKASVRLGDDRFQQEVEPATNYFVSRISRDLNNGNLKIGGIATSVARSFSDDVLRAALNSHSEGLGFDAEYWWANRTYHILAQTAFTNISGDPDAILRAQQSSARYFQRPDREHGSNGLFSDEYDPNATSMRGFGSYFRIAREGGNLRWETSLNVRSPGFENNDIAALSRADYIWLHGNLNRRWTKPGSFYRSAGLTVGGQRQYNFDGDVTAGQAHMVGWVELPNYWEVGAWSSLRPSVMDDRRTRGGPVVATPSERNLEAWINSNRNKRIYFNLNHNNYAQSDGGHTVGFGTGVTWQPMSNVAITVGPSYQHAHGKSQYITAADDATAELFYGRRYIFSDIDSKTLSMDTRVNVTFSPTMSLQLFAQPFISSNDFSQWKQYARPRVVDKQVFGRDVGTVTEQQNANGGRIVIDPDANGPAASIDFANPDFTFRSLRGNAVFRWEYIPGSTLYLVWTQDRASEVERGGLDFSRDRSALFDSPANHVFLIKVNYWLPM